MAIEIVFTATYENGVAKVMDGDHMVTHHVRNPITREPWASEEEALEWANEVAFECSKTRARPLEGDYEWDDAAEEWVAVPEPVEEPSA